MIDGPFVPELAIANREDAGAEKGGNEEVEGGEDEESVEECGEVVREVGEVEETGERLCDTAEEGGEGEGHGGGVGRSELDIGDVHGACF